MLRKGEVVFAGSIEDLLFNQKPLIIVSTLDSNDLERVAEIARSEGHHVTIRSNQAHIEGPHEWAPILNKKAFEAGITLAQLTPTLPNLEETFFEMTGGR
jgi:ABC-2 type transport system ATP-binding protein